MLPTTTFRDVPTTREENDLLTPLYGRHVDCRDRFLPERAPASRELSGFDSLAMTPGLVR